MAKYKRTKVGSFLKSKNEEMPPYLKISADITLKAGDMIRVESKKFQVNSLTGAINAGKIPAEMGEKLLESANKIPDFVLGDLIILKSE